MTIIYKSPYPSYTIPTSLSISQWLLEYNPENTLPEKIIFEDFDAPFKTISYGGIREAAAQGAAGLKEVLGLREGDVVAIVATNSVDWAVLAHSVMWAGGVVCAINPVATPYELVHYLGVAGARFIFADEDVVSNISKALELGGKTTSIAIVGDEGASTQHRRFPRDFISDSRAPLPPFGLSQRDNRKIPAAICFSSGTSGKPKGVMLSHHNAMATVLAARATAPEMNRGDQREVFYPPFSHIYGIFTVNFVPFIGQYAVIMRHYNFEAYIKRCAEIRATILRLVPATAVSITKDPFIKGLDLSSVEIVTCAGAPLQEGVVRMLQGILRGTSIIQGYGLSETTVSILRPHLSVRKTGSVGQLVAGTEVRIVDDDYNDVIPGESGELLVRSASVFMGYIDNPTETAASYKDSWFCTGDIVRIDSEGFLWLTDRKKELIKYKGNQVAPAELEDVLLSHPRVREAAVCGTYDEGRQTEIPVAYVNLQDGVDGARVGELLGEIRKFVDEKVSPHKGLRGGVHILDVMPRNINGKLVRRLLPAKVDEERKKGRKESKL